MKNYIFKVFILAAAFMLIFAAIDAVFWELQSFKHYLIGAVIFTVLLIGFNYLDAKGWNSWKRIGRLFKKKDS